jgi:hypothetical protein
MFHEDNTLDSPRHPTLETHLSFSCKPLPSAIREWVYYKGQIPPLPLQPSWKGPLCVILTTLTAVKLQGYKHWVCVSSIQQSSSPPMHHPLLLFPAPGLNPPTSKPPICPPSRRLKNWLLQLYQTFLQILQSQLNNYYLPQENLTEIILDLWLQRDLIDFTSDQIFILFILPFLHIPPS